MNLASPGVDSCGGGRPLEASGRCSEPRKAVSCSNLGDGEAHVIFNFPARETAAR